MIDDKEPIITYYYKGDFVVRCIVCEGRFVLSKRIDNRGRNCPLCGESRAYVDSDKKTILMHRIKKNESICDRETIDGE